MNLLAASLALSGVAPASDRCIKPLRLAPSFVLALAAASMALSACSTNAATGRRQLDIMSRDQEVALGVEAAPELTKSYGGAVPDQELRDYVTRVGTSLLSGVEKEYRNLPWEFTLLNSGVINAFSLPGGKVFMSRALMERMTNEAQLAGVLGHEIAHVTAEHVDQRLGRNAILQVGAAVGGAVGGESYGQLIEAGILQGGGLYALKFDRGEETEADTLGVRYMVRAGYNPQGQVQVMQILKDAMGSSSRSGEWTSTHPLPETRIRELSSLLKKKYAKQLDDPAYQFHEAAFKPYLERLKRLPPAPKPVQTQ